MFSNSKKKPEKFLLISIGSGSVAFSVCNPTTPKPTIEWITRVPFILGEELNFNLFTEALFVSLNDGLERFIKERISGIKKVYVVYSSPWFFSQTQKIYFEKKVPFKVTEKLVHECVQKELERFEKEVLPTKVGNIPMEIIENYTIDASINGYRVPTPYHKEAKNIELAVFLSFAPKDLNNKIEKIIDKQVSLAERNIRSSTNTFSSYLFLRDLFKDDQSYLFVSIDTEISEIALCKNGVLIETVSLPLGNAEIVRTMNTELKKTNIESISLLSSYFSNALTEESKKQVDDVLKVVGDVWLSQFQKVLALMSDHLTLPNKVFLEVNGDGKTWYKDLIMGEAFGQYLVTDQKFQVISLNGDFIKEYVLLKNAEYLHDVRLIIETVHIFRLYYLYAKTV